MSLLTEYMEDCHYVDKTTSPDGYGGIIQAYSEGAPFRAAIVYDTSLEARRADKEGVRNLYTITTSKSVVLMSGDIFSRDADGRIFKITSDGVDKMTPSSATLDMRVVTAEELKTLPGDIQRGGG